MLTEPPTLAREVLVPSMVTGPAEDDTDSEPVTGVDNSASAVAPLELTEPPTEAPLAHRAPPEILIEPVTLAFSMQTDWPLDMVSDPLTVVVIQASLKPTLIVRVAVAEV
jgi:hypothetical protein